MDRFRDCDVAMRFTSDKLRDSKFPIKSIVTSAMVIIPCAISSEVPTDIALAKLREYMKREIPELVDIDFSFEEIWHNHVMTSFPDSEDIIFITQSGCSLGQPKTEA